LRRIAVRGLVGLADRARAQLAMPITADALVRLKTEVDQAVRMVDLLLARHRASLNALPGPTRRAHQYLRGLDFGAVDPRETEDDPPHLPASVRFPGLRSYLDQVLDDLAALVDQPDRRADAHRSLPHGRGLVGRPLDELHDSIRLTSQSIEERILAEGLAPQHLTRETTRTRGWLAYFTRRDHFEAYVAALGRAVPRMEEIAHRAGRFAIPVIVHFRPTKSLYRFRRLADRTRLTLPTPMISFEGSTFALLAEMAFLGRGDKKLLWEQTRRPSYLAVQAQLDELAGLGGARPAEAGVCHDLVSAFDEVNGTYFHARMPRPRLVWSRQVTGRKFGHYDHTNDTLMVSSTLDTYAVPRYVVEFVVYHELLHKKHGVRWHNGRQVVHTRELRCDERKFRQYDEAEAKLKQLANRYA
jgi:hypothetical protein